MFRRPISNPRVDRGFEWLCSDFVFVKYFEDLLHILGFSNLSPAVRCHDSAMGNKTFGHSDLILSAPLTLELKGRRSEAQIDDNLTEGCL